MIWYLLNILIITIAYLWPTKQTEEELGYETSKAVKKRVCIVGSLGWIILSGLRHLSIGADTEAYSFSYDRIKKMSWDKLFQDLYDKYFLGEEIKDPGFEIIEKASHFLTDSYQVFLVMIAVLFFVCLGVFIYKFSNNPYISYILFSTLFYSFFAITGHRQTIATAFVVLLGSFLIYKKKLISFLIVVLLASTIHMSCLCFIPFYFISRIKINKLTLLMYWVGVAGSFVFRYQLLDLLQSMIGYENYQDYEGASAGTFLYLLLAIGVVVTFFHKKLLEGDNQLVVQMAINALMLACFFSPLLLINQSMMRLVQYFSLFLMIILPNIVKIFAKKNDKTIYTMVIVVVLVGLLAMTNPVYKYFWQ